MALIVAVLDASAVLALLLEERGSEIVAPLTASSAISAANLAEVLGHYVLRGADVSKLSSMIDELELETVSITESQAYVMAGMLTITRRRGLSLADRACLSLARGFGVPAYTADRAWADVAADLGVTVELIR